MFLFRKKPDQPAKTAPTLGYVFAFSNHVEDYKTRALPVDLRKVLEERCQATVKTITDAEGYEVQFDKPSDTKQLPQGFYNVTVIDTLLVPPVMMTRAYYSCKAVHSGRLVDDCDYQSMSCTDKASHLRYSVSICKDKSVVVAIDVSKSTESLLRGRADRFCTGEAHQELGAMAKELPFSTIFGMLPQDVKPEKGDRSKLLFCGAQFGGGVASLAAVYARELALNKGMDVDTFAIAFDPPGYALSSLSLSAADLRFHLNIFSSNLATVSMINLVMDASLAVEQAEKNPFQIGDFQKAAMNILTGHLDKEKEFRRYKQLQAEARNVVKSAMGSSFCFRPLGDCLIVDRRAWKLMKCSTAMDAIIEANIMAVDSINVEEIPWTDGLEHQFSEKTKPIPLSLTPLLQGIAVLDLGNDVWEVILDGFNLEPVLNRHLGHAKAAESPLVLENVNLQTEIQVSLFTPMKARFRIHCCTLNRGSSVQLHTDFGMSNAISVGDIKKQTLSSLADLAVANVNAQFFECAFIRGLIDHMHKRENSMMTHLIELEQTLCSSTKMKDAVSLYQQQAVETQMHWRISQMRWRLHGKASAPS